MAELGKKDKEALAHLYETEQYFSFKKFLDIECTNIGKRLLLAPAADAVVISRLQGQADAMKQLHLQLKAFHKQSSSED